MVVWCALIVTLGAALPAEATTLVRLRWQANTEPDLAGYRLRYGTAPGSYTENVDVGNATTYEIYGLDPAKTYSFVVHAYNLADNVSLPSNEVLARPTAFEEGSTTRTYFPTADACVAANVPDQNLGTTETLIADADPLRRSYLRFEVKGLEAGAVNRAVLGLTVRPERISGAAVSGGDLYRITPSPWEETTLTYSTSPPVVGGTLASAGPVRPGDVVELDVKGAVTGDGTYEFVLANRSDDGAFYFSREAGVSGPQLVVTVQVAGGSERKVR